MSTAHRAAQQHSTQKRAADTTAASAPEESGANQKQEQENKKAHVRLLAALLSLHAGRGNIFQLAADTFSDQAQPDQYARADLALFEKGDNTGTDDPARLRIREVTL